MAIIDTINLVDEDGDLHILAYKPWWNEPISQQIPKDKLDQFKTWWYSLDPNDRESMYLPSGIAEVNEVVNKAIDDPDHTTWSDLLELDVKYYDQLADENTLNGTGALGAYVFLLAEYLAENKIIKRNDDQDGDVPDLSYYGNFVTTELIPWGISEYQLFMDNHDNRAKKEDEVNM